MHSALKIKAPPYCGTTSSVCALTETTASNPEERKASCVKERKNNFS